MYSHTLNYVSSRGRTALYHDGAAECAVIIDFHCRGGNVSYIHKYVNPNFI